MTGACLLFDLSVGVCDISTLQASTRSVQQTPCRLRPSGYLRMHVCMRYAYSHQRHTWLSSNACFCSDYIQPSSCSSVLLKKNGRKGRLFSHFLLSPSQIRPTQCQELTVPAMYNIPTECCLLLLVTYGDTWAAEGQSRRLPLCL